MKKFEERFGKENSLVLLKVSYLSYGPNGSRLDHFRTLLKWHRDRKGMTMIWSDLPSQPPFGWNERCSYLDKRGKTFDFYSATSFGYLKGWNTVCVLECNDNHTIQNACHRRTRCQNMENPIGFNAGPICDQPEQYPAVAADGPSFNTVGVQEDAFPIAQAIAQNEARRNAEAETAEQGMTKEEIM